jgi:AraC-like DNA-binding protein
MILTPMQHDHAGEAELLDELRAGPFRVTHKHYTHDFAQGYHAHEGGSIDLILEGGGRGIYAGREIVSHAGMVEFFREEIRHKFLGGGGGIRTMHVLLPGNLLRDISQLRDIACETLTHTRALRLSIALLRELRCTDRSSSLETESLIHELIDEVTNAAAAPNPRAGWIGTVRDALHALHDRPVTLDELALAAGVNRAHLARVFKSKLGVSVGQYHRSVRAHRAARRLTNHDASIARVARETGFADQAHLTRVFGDHFGITPSAYRRCLRRR